MSVVNPEVKSDWDYIQSAFFASTVLTTIGKLSVINYKYSVFQHRLSGKTNINLYAEEQVVMKL